MSTRPLQAMSWLGDNTLPMLNEIAAGLRGLGFAVEAAVAPDRSSAGGRRLAPDVDLVWMCGALTVRSIAAVSLAGAGPGAGALGSHRIVAAPVFSPERAPVYRSVIVARPDGPDTVEAALAYPVAVNELASWSGHLGLRRFVAATWGPNRWFADTVLTGSHRASVETVAGIASGGSARPGPGGAGSSGAGRSGAGRGDRDATDGLGGVGCAAIDESVWHALVAEQDPAALALRVIGVTDDWASPPFSLARRLDASLQRDLVDALCSLAPRGLSAIVPASADDYATMG